MARPRARPAVSRRSGWAAWLWLCSSDRTVITGSPSVRGSVRGERDGENCRPGQGGGGPQVVGGGPGRDVAVPVSRSAGAARPDPVEGLVARHMEDDGYADRAEEIQQPAAQQV